MTTKEYLAMSGMNAVELSEILGHKTTSSITKKMEVEMPKRWVRLLDERDATPAVGGSDNGARTHNLPPSGEDGEPDWEQAFRTEQDSPRPPGDESYVGPQKIKLSTVEGYIQQIYGGAAAIADSRGDDLAADVIRRYTPEFSEAWIDYIRADPRLLEYLEKMMIGTPLGNLIGVHAIAIGSYAFARIAARQIATAAAAESHFDGSGNDSA